MKVLQINAVCGIKSTGRICVEIANYINCSGNEGYIAYSVGLPYENGYRIGTAIDTKLHALNSRVFGTQAYFSKSCTNKLLKYIKNIKPDVVHLHNLHSNFINLKLLLNYLAENDIPTVLTLHDCWFYTGKCTHYTMDNCNKWQTGCYNCVRLKKDNPSWILDRTKTMWQDKKILFEKIPRLAVVGVSDWITNEAKKSMLSSAQILKRIYNWIDLDVFKQVETKVLRNKLKLENKFIIIGVASSWNNDKGLNKFIELSNILPDDIIIILVGNVSSFTKFPKNILSIKETHNISELIEYYSIADVLLNLSLAESFGKVSAEALSCGTPIITFKSTASPELVGDGCGYVIDRNSIEDILNAILKVRKDGKKYYSNKCVSYAKANFNKDERINDYLKLYQDLTKIIRRNK
jgi:glycosyltransferase involved in cell wall biosynthesis